MSHSVIVAFDSRDFEYSSKSLLSNPTEGDRRRTLCSKNKNGFQKKEVYPKVVFGKQTINISIYLTISQVVNPCNRELNNVADN